MDALYGNYREDAYLEARQHWEPWYRKGANEATAPGSAVTADRVKFLDALLEKFDLRKLGVVVDFGGDMGQFFPAAAMTRYLLDPSDRQVVDGVVRITSWAKLPSPPDLVIVAHVLEHVNDPAALLAEVRRELPEGGYLYVEVPLDMPRLRPWHSSSGYAHWIHRLRRHRLLFILLDFYSGLCRNFGLRVPRLGVVKQSEHINYFSSRSLVALLPSNGFRLLGSLEDRDFRVGRLRMGRLGVLAVAE